VSPEAEEGYVTRTRRSGDEVRARLVEAARHVFAEYGYAGATTKGIAERAEVGEVLLFRHFGTKAGLFEAAVLGSLETFVDVWLARWAHHSADSDSTETLARLYVELLYEFLEENRQLVTALLSAQAHHPAAAERLQSIFDRLAKTVREGADEYALTMDPDITVRLTFGMVLSTVQHADIFFASRVPSREELVDHLTRYMLHGISTEPATLRPGRKPRRS
jgi:AcrR family transcriptional regulator